MNEEKKEGSNCSPKGCGCCPGKVLVGLLIAAFIFAAGMWFAQAHCHCHMGNGSYCPFSAPGTK